ncbi:MAG: glycosyltransferase family 4 protein [Candidatus Acidiferrales bacterium]
MKIVLVHNRYQQGGGEDVVFAQERWNLERAGHDVVAYHRSNWEIDDPATLGERLALAKNTVWSVRTRRDFAEVLARETPDIVHVHNTFVVISPSIYGACQEHGVPVVQTLHNFRLICPAATFYRDGNTCEECLGRSLWSAVHHGCYRGSRTATATVALMLATHRLLGTWCDSIDSYIALTAFSRDKFIAAGFNPDKIFVKPNFIDPDPGPRAVVGDYAVFTGRLSPEKGVMTLLRAWERLPVRCPLQIVGDGPERPRLEAFARERNIRGVIFRGRLTHEETVATVKGARFAIVPSVYYEGFPMVIAEAMACGVPIVCSRLGAMEEIVADGVTGLHFSAGDPDDLTRKVEWAWRHSSEMRQMGRAARCEYETRYTADRNYSRLMDIYERTLHRQIDSIPAVSS